MQEISGNWIPNSLAFIMRPDAKKFVQEAGDDKMSKINNLPNGKIFDDAKNIESVFKKSSHSTVMFWKPLKNIGIMQKSKQ